MAKFSQVHVIISEIEGSGLDLMHFCTDHECESFFLAQFGMLGCCILVFQLSRMDNREEYQPGGYNEPVVALFFS